MKKEPVKIKIDKRLDKYDNKVLFPEKVKAAKELVKNLSLSTICKNRHAL